MTVRAGREQGGALPKSLKKRKVASEHSNKDSVQYCAAA